MATNQICSIRERITSVVSREERVNILASLRATIPTIGEGSEKGSMARYRINPKAVGAGKRLLEAINAFDIACLKGDEEEIAMKGEKLIGLWKRHKNEIG